MTSAMRPCMSLTHIYLYPQAIDFRKSFRGISAIVECELGCASILMFETETP
jgi:transposase